MAAGFVFHLPGSVLRDRSLMKPYYVRLTEGLAARGWPVRLEVHDRARLLDLIAQDEDCHIVDHGRQRHPRLLNTGIAYIYPFWNLDPWGIRALSSIATKPFDPDAVDAGAAAAFATRLRRRLLDARKSRYEQPEAVTPVPPGCIAVFLQAEAHRDVTETCHLTLRQMVRALIARDDPRAIVIKPHPLDTDPDTRRFLRRMAGRDARVRVLDANIHDILAQASVTVTINSAVGLESLMHRVPVVLCGRTDFHHACRTATAAASLDAEILQAGAHRVPFDAYLYWYLGLNCLNAGNPRLLDDFLERVAATGFPMLQTR